MDMNVLVNQIPMTAPVGVVPGSLRWTLSANGVIVQQDIDNTPQHTFSNVQPNTDYLVDVARLDSSGNVLHSVDQQTTSPNGPTGDTYLGPVALSISYT